MLLRWWMVDDYIIFCLLDVKKDMLLKDRWVGEYCALRTVLVLEVANIIIFNLLFSNSRFRAIITIMSTQSQIFRGTAHIYYQQQQTTVCTIYRTCTSTV